MRFQLYIKSHTDFPDYDQEVEADSRGKALDYFYRQFEKGGWSKEQLNEYLKEVDMEDIEDRNDDSAKYEMEYDDEEFIEQL